MTDTCAYPLGVAALVRGDPEVAAHAFAAAVAADPTSAVAHAAHAAALIELGAADDAVLALGRARQRRGRSRRVRHHVDVITMVLTGEVARATVLGSEHLAEFPEDDVVRYVLARWAG